MQLSNNPHVSEFFYHVYEKLALIARQQIKQKKQQIKKNHKMILIRGNLRMTSIPVPITHYLIFSAIIFSLSIAGIIMNRRNLLILLMLKKLDGILMSLQMFSSDQKRKELLGWSYFVGVLLKTVVLMTKIVLNLKHL